MTNAYHEHLDGCAWCASHPFDLCPAGLAALKESTFPGLCGKYLGDNDGTCPQLTCIRLRGHKGLCDNVSGHDDEPTGESIDAANTRTIGEDR